jgi:FMN reductase
MPRSSDARAYFDGVAVGCISCASGWQAGGQTLAALRAIVHALRRWRTPLGVALNTSTKLFDEDENCVDSAVMSQLHRSPSRGIC